MSKLQATRLFSVPLSSLTRNTVIVICSWKGLSWHEERQYHADTTCNPDRVDTLVPSCLLDASSRSQCRIWLTLPAQIIYLSSPNGPWASIHLGVHKANATIKPHKMASSSSSWPTRLRVAWKYAELTPITMNKAQIMFTPEHTCLEYGRNRYLQQEEVDF